MSKEVMNEVNQVTMDVEETVLETKAEGKISKGVKWVKNNSKKVLAGAGLVTGGLICYALGKMNRSAVSEEYYGVEDSETVDYDNSDIETE